MSELDKTPPVAMRKCVACAELIDVDARVCKYCKVSQSWLRHLSVGTTTLALVTALISVTATALPIIRKSLTPDDSNVRLVFQGRDPDDASILLLAYNSGTKPGGLGRSVLKMRSLDPAIQISFQQELTTVDKDKESSMVQEGHGRQFRLHLAKSLNHSKFADIGPEKMKCVLEFETAEFVGPSKRLVIERSCEDLYGDTSGSDPSAPIDPLLFSDPGTEFGDEPDVQPDKAIDRLTEDPANSSE